MRFTTVDLLFLVGFFALAFASRPPDDIPSFIQWFVEGGVVSAFAAVRFRGTHSHANTRPYALAALTGSMWFVISFISWWIMAMIEYSVIPADATGPPYFEDGFLVSAVIFPLIWLMCLIPLGALVGVTAATVTLPVVDFCADRCPGGKLLGNSGVDNEVVQQRDG